jgi:hypothetical protein
MDQIRRVAAAYDGPVLSRGARGAEIGATTNAINKAASSIGLEIEPRAARLALASEVLGRQVESYNELSDGELKAVVGWASNNVGRLAQWLGMRYGFTLEMDL